eukprot:CAMPEP_0184675098 /NCGR_PEP_ID=MMETSP0308-20130426/87577_1 /TAXON_ID=38269 /ORGANISM="Gloeochaete witrockiana, Strain SAG 46.84" /LENGTH=201 /DNA_ID=CAMNT_0027122773 /DNA_START=167 /DNA_END=772 /DNA_ORIENTATION=+
MLTLRRTATSELIIKKSRFIAKAARVRNVDEATAFIRDSSERDARHNCYAYRISPSVMKCNDDGEPGGTAGSPILRAIEGQNLFQVCVVVVRYFGGIKLGAGGLLRAYAGAATECLQLAEKETLEDIIMINITVPFPMLGTIYPLLEKYASTREQAEYDDAGGTMRVRIGVKSSIADEFSQSLRDASKGKVTIELGERTTL